MRIATRSIVNWYGRRMKTMKRSSNEYKEVTKLSRARTKEMSDAYKGLYKHYKVVWKCYKKGTTEYNRWYSASASIAFNSLKATVTHKSSFD